MIDKNIELNNYISSGNCWTYVVQNLHHISPDIKNNFVDAYTKALSSKEALKAKIENSLESNSSLGVPQNTIWFFWLQGLSDAPESVQISLRSWKTLNPEYNIIVLTNENLANYFPFWDAFS